MKGAVHVLNCDNFKEIQPYMSPLLKSRMSLSCRNQEDFYKKKMVGAVGFAVLWLFCHVQASQGGICPELCTCDTTTAAITCYHGYFRHLGTFLNAITPSTKTIFIMNGNFHNVPSQMQNFKHLEYLTLTNCKIGAVDSQAFTGLKDLQEVRMPNNMIGELDSALFKDQKKLRTLDLSHNSLQTLPKGVFDALGNITLLNLKHNKLERLHPEVFNNLTKLQFLDISFNRLYYIHPVTFSHLPSLQSLQMSSNFISFLQESTFQNTTSLEKVFLEDNPWDCTCGVKWLVEDLKQKGAPYQNTDRIKCVSPLSLKSKTLLQVPVQELVCTGPQVMYASTSSEYYLMHDITLKCNVTGSPQPNIYWKTPHGHILSHNEHHRYIGPDILEFKPAHHIFHTMLKYGAVSTPQVDGSLRIRQIRQYFAGEYTCFGVNPLGVATAQMNVTVVSAMATMYGTSLIIGSILMVASLIIGIIIGLIRMCVEKLLGRRRVHEKKDIPALMETGPPESTGCSSEEDLSKRSSPRFFHHLHFWSPQASPEKYETPPYSDPEWDRYCDEDEYGDGDGLKETLEEVRARLREGVGRKMERVRQKTQHLRDSSTVYMQNIRDTASHSMQTIRESSQQYATRVRHGVQLGVEQVKYHVQSMKELCGTGDLGQTISAISISTNVDSQESTAVVKQTTFV